MLIRVMYDDGKFDMVKPQLLDTLLRAESLTSYKNSKTWAVVDRDAIRSRSRGTVAAYPSNQRFGVALTA
jgi:hypothetical protein